MGLSASNLAAIQNTLNATKAARLGMISRSYLTLTGSATNTEIIGNGSDGPTFLKNARLLALQFFGEVNTQGAATFTITVYKGSIAAGNAAFAITVDANQAAATDLAGIDVSVNNAGMDLFTPSDLLIAEGVWSAAAGVIRNASMDLIFAYEE